MDFPETAVTTRSGLHTTDELSKPSLYSESLHWSWGAMKGRPENLTPSFANRPLESLLPDLAALGFDGIYMDRALFIDNGKEIEARLETLAGTRPLVSKDGTKSFFDLRPFEHQLPPSTSESREAALYPLRLEWDRGFQVVDGAGQFYPKLDGVTSGRWASRDATLHVRNSRSKARRLSLHAEAHLDGTTGTLEVRARHEKRVFQLTATPTPITIDLEIPPGTTTVSFHSSPSMLVRTLGRSLGDFRLNGVWWEAPLVSARS
jgi:phosphoglycerol transferase